MGLRQRAIVLAKLETTYGTDAVPSAASDAILAFNPTINPVGAKIVRDPMRDTISPSPGLIGSRYVEFTFETDLYASGAAGTAPRAGALFQACSMTETIVALTSATYKPNSLGTSAKSVTIYYYADEGANARLHKITGCVGTFELVAKAGEPARLRWTFRGLYAVPTSVAFPTPTYEAGINTPPKALSTNLTVNAISTFVAQQVTITLENMIATRPDVNSATGIKGFVITDRKGKGTWNPESFPIATYDLWTDWINATLRQLSMVLGSGAGNICTITCPKLMIDDIQQQEREKLEIWNIPFSLAYNTGDDEISIVYT